MNDKHNILPSSAKQLSDYLLTPSSHNFFLIAGPCAIEDADTPRYIAERLLEITSRLDIPFVFKASYRKANRSRIDSFTGIGDETAMRILGGIRQEFQIPTLTDIHETQEAPLAAEVADILQIPAFLCRQTELIRAAALTGRHVNIKKGQFLSPESMIHAVDKVRSTGNKYVTVTDRGTSFGYTDMIVDPRAIPVMKQVCQCPAIMDITHSLQQPNQASGVTGGLPALISVIARSAIATGADGLFIETHPDPSRAKSDGANMLHLDRVEPLLRQLVTLRQTIIQLDNEKI